MFQKKLAVAALVTLCAVSAFGSNFRGADQVYIPIAGHAAGASGTFISDVYLANLSSDEVDVSVIFQQLGAGGGTGIEFKNRIQLKAYERKEYNDFMEVLRAFPEGTSMATSAIGQLIFNACKKGADCGPASQDANGVSPNYRNIVATSRIYSIPPGGNSLSPTTGQLFTGIPWYHFVSSLQSAEGLDKVFITGFRQTGSAGQAGTFRANIGLVNASQYSTTTFVVRLYQGTMTDADKKGEYVASNIGPLGNVQVSFPAAFPGITGTNYFVTVHQTNNIPTGDAPAGCTQGCPAFLAYGSVLDNVSGDATTLEAIYNVALSDDALIVIYPGAGKIGVRRSVRH